MTEHPLNFDEQVNLSKQYFYVRRFVSLPLIFFRNKRQYNKHDKLEEFPV